MAAHISAKPRAPEEYTVGWICALSKEQTAATSVLDETHPDLDQPPTDHNVYTLGSIGRHNVVITCLPQGKYGTNSAAMVVTQMVRTFPSLKVGLMVGIGGGIPPKVSLGDIVVGTPVDIYPGVVQWDLGKAEKDGDFRRTGALNNPANALLTAVTKLQTKHAMRGHMMYQHLNDIKGKWPNLPLAYTMRPSSNDSLRRLDARHPRETRHNVILAVWNIVLALFSYILGGWAFHPVSRGDEQAEKVETKTNDAGHRRISEDTQVHYGLIASGNQVVKDAKIRDKIDESLGGHVLCIEMEAAGLMLVFPCIVIRGICDYADSAKNKDWQEYAASMAAAYAKELLACVQPNTIKAERAMKDIIQQLVDTTSRTNSNVEAMKAKLDKKEDLEILSWLTPVDYSSQQNDTFRRRHPETGGWLLTSDKYQHWIKNPKQMLFCPGMPGAGKTILTSVVVSDVYHKFANENVGIAYIYCNFRRQTEQTLDALLGSLLKQLSLGRLSLPGVVKDLYVRYEKNRMRPPIDELTEALRSVLSSYSRTFIIVDALDEYQDGYASKLLSKLLKFQGEYEATINIFATSRFGTDVVGLFKEVETLEIRASDEDVQRYVEARVLDGESAILKRDDLQPKVISAIIAAADGMFLLAKLHLDSLFDMKLPEDIETRLEALPRASEAYTATYKEAMERIKRQGPKSVEFALRILTWVSCAKRPLTTPELQHALAVKVGQTTFKAWNLPDTKDMVSVCAGLVTIDEESDIIRLVHYTTQEFLEQTQSQWLSKPEMEITEICVTYLSFTDFKSGLCETDHKLSKRLQSYKLYKYAAENWGHHARYSAQCEEVSMNFLRSQSNVEASYQVLNHRWAAARMITGLHLAAYFGLPAATNSLLDYCQNADPVDSQHQTPLSYAAQRGHEAITTLLLDRGAEIDSKDTDGQTPLSYAADRGHEAITTLLLDRGAEIDSKDTYGWTPLSYAAQMGHKAITTLLLDRGAEVDSKDTYGWTPLSYAAQGGHEAITTLLLDRGAEVDLKDTDGQTPLSYAAQGGHEAITTLLLDRGAEVDSKDDLRI